jgi:hypothetical protein
MVVMKMRKRDMRDRLPVQTKLRHTKHHAVSAVQQQTYGTRFHHVAGAHTVCVRRCRATSYDGEAH